MDNGRGKMLMAYVVYYTSMSLEGIGVGHFKHDSHFQAEQ